MLVNMWTWGAPALGFEKKKKKGGVGGGGSVLVQTISVLFLLGENTVIKEAPNVIWISQCNKLKLLPFEHQEKTAR